MTTILFILGLFAIIGGIVIYVFGRGRRTLATARGRDVETPAGYIFWRWLVIGGLVAVGAAIATTFIVVVPAGFVGVVTNFGRVEDRTIPAGLQVVTPIAEQVVLVDVRVQPHTFQEIEAASQEYQSVKLTGTMNYHIDPAFAWELYKNVGLDFAEKVIDPAFNDFIKEVIPDYQITEILNKRDEIRRLAKEKLGQNFERYHIIVDDIYLANIRFSPEYEQAIEQKQVAQQQVETEKEILAQKQIQAQQRVAEAQGEAAAAIERAKGDAQSNIERSRGQASATVEISKGDAEASIQRANGQAQANKTLAASLSDPILTYTYIQKLSDKITVALIPGGQQFLFDLKSLITAPASSASPTEAP